MCSSASHSASKKNGKSGPIAGGGSGRHNSHSGLPDRCDSSTACRLCRLEPPYGVVVVVYPLPWPLLVGGVRCSRLWSTSRLLRPSGQQCSHSGGVCPQIQGRQCGAYVGAVEEMMCVVCVDVTEGAYW